MGTRREMEPERRREKLLVAGLECLATRGYDGVRLKDVAQAAGVSIGLVQHHFDSRDQLLEEVFRKASRDLAEAWRAADGRSPSPWDRVELLLGRIDNEARDSSIVWTELGAASARHHHLRGIFTEIYALWDGMLRGAVEAGIADGSFHPTVSIDQAIAMLLAHSDGCEFAIAVALPSVSSRRLSDNSCLLARLLLGYDDSSRV